MKRAGKAARIAQLIEAGAWDDAALALIELELPAWKLRRLVYEDGEWFCALSRQPNLPVALDDTVDASHEVLSLAILSAFVEARRRASAMRETSLQVPPVRQSSATQFVATTSAEQLSLAGDRADSSNRQGNRHEISRASLEFEILRSF